MVTLQVINNLHFSGIYQRCHTAADEGGNSTMVLSAL